MQKRAQHYVWKHYLEPWTNNGSIWCSRDGKGFCTNPKNIGQERDFYKLREMSQLEIDTISRLFIDKQAPGLKELNIGWINTTQLVFRLKRKLQERGLMTDEAKKIIDTEIINAEENLYEKYEKNGAKILASLLNKNTEFYNTEEGVVDFIHYVCSQYFRTKSIQESVINSTSYQASYNTASTMNALRHILTTTLSWNINNKKTQWKPILITTTTKLLLTSDQPVINTFAPRNREAESEDLEFYYPVSPHIAVLFTQDRAKKDKGDFCATDEQIDDYNKKIIEQSHSQVYADSQETLEAYGLSEK